MTAAVLSRIELQDGLQNAVRGLIKDGKLNAACPTPTHRRAVRQSLESALTWSQALNASPPIRTIDNPRSIDEAKQGRCQRGDVIVEGHGKGLFIGMAQGPSNVFPVIFWDTINPLNERFLALCETFDNRTRNIKRKTGGTTHKSRKRAPHNGNERQCREIDRCQKP